MGKVLANKLFTFGVLVFFACDIYSQSGLPQGPMVVPAGMSFTNSIIISITDASPGSQILYTLDGTEPDTVVRASTHLYSSPIVIDSTSTLKVISKLGGVISLVKTEVYTKITTGLLNKKKVNIHSNIEGRIFDLLGRGIESSLENKSECMVALSRK